MSEVKSALEVYYYCYEKGDTVSIPLNWHITRNFQWSEAFKNEIASDRVPFYDVFLRIEAAAKEFQKVRDHLGKAMHPHCWYRSIEHNVRAYIENGFSAKEARTKTKLSVHLYGSALDFHIEGMTDSQVRALLSAGISAEKYKIRIENNTKGWVHIDTGCPFIANGYKWGLFEV